MKPRKFFSFRGTKKPLQKEKHESETIEKMGFRVRRGYPIFRRRSAYLEKTEGPWDLGLRMMRSVRN